MTLVIFGLETGLLPHIRSFCSLVFFHRFGLDETLPRHMTMRGSSFYDGGGGGVEGGGGRGCLGVGGFLLRRTIATATTTIMMAAPAMM
jgi:hypothetical protein